MAAAWQKTTHDWWDLQRSRFDLYTSQVSMEEAGRGDPDAAVRRVDALSALPLLAITDAVMDFSKALIERNALPATALDDALHVAVSAVHGIDYLLTWNFRHLDNAETKPIVRAVCIAEGYATPEICTPQELMGANDNGR
ncbi:MAG TPA: type II toxin-antitoxin system VapC family toxin [Candidatus Latescibacteria bacterium]|nr:type II toxin-antitoxin system VapC family toxin [Candidatus Latescibacterota bacterium]